jgi:hypothetical protein
MLGIVFKFSSGRFSLLSVVFSETYLAQLKNVPHDLLHSLNVRGDRDRTLRFQELHPFVRRQCECCS